jgi:hypothetical protein
MSKHVRSGGLGQAVAGAGLGLFLCCGSALAQGAPPPPAVSVGTPVFGGMIAASLFGIFIIPLLYITAEQSRQWRQWGRWRQGRGSTKVK